MLCFLDWSRFFKIIIDGDSHALQVVKYFLLEYLIEILDVKKICTSVDSKIPLIVNCPEENIMENNTCIKMYITVFFKVVKNETKSK